jgi:hypothetical protein
MKRNLEGINDERTAKAARTDSEIIIPDDDHYKWRLDSEYSNLDLPAHVFPLFELVNDCIGEILIRMDDTSFQFLRFTSKRMMMSIKKQAKNSTLFSYAVAEGHINLARMVQEQFGFTTYRSTFITILRIIKVQNIQMLRNMVNLKQLHCIPRIFASFELSQISDWLLRFGTPSQVIIFSDIIDGTGLISDFIDIFIPQTTKCGRIDMLRIATELFDKFGSTMNLQMDFYFDKFVHQKRMEVCEELLIWYKKHNPSYNLDHQNADSVLPYLTESLEWRPIPLPFVRDLPVSFDTQFEDITEIKQLTGKLKRGNESIIEYYLATNNRLYFTHNLDRRKKIDFFMDSDELHNYISHMRCPDIVPFILRHRYNSDVVKFLKFSIELMDDSRYITYRADIFSHYHVGLDDGDDDGDNLGFLYVYVAIHYILTGNNILYIQGAIDMNKVLLKICNFDIKLLESSFTFNDSEIAIFKEIVSMMVNFRICQHKSFIITKDTLQKCVTLMTLKDTDPRLIEIIQRYL